MAVSGVTSCSIIINKSFLGLSWPIMGLGLPVLSHFKGFSSIRNVYPCCQATEKCTRQKANIRPREEPRPFVTDHILILHSRSHAVSYSLVKCSCQLSPIILGDPPHHPNQQPQVTLPSQILLPSFSFTAKNSIGNQCSLFLKRRGGVLIKIFTYTGLILRISWSSYWNTNSRCSPQI